jgi:Tol biopolymer transport system component
VRKDQLFRLDLEPGRVRRLTTGFRSRRHPRFLPSGRILTLWSAEKRHGIEVMDADGKNLETLVDGTVFYRTIAPSPDGRFLVATFTYDLAFHPAEILRIRQAEEVRLLSARGEPLATLAGSWRQAQHSPDWGE